MKARYGDECHFLVDTRGKKLERRGLYHLVNPLALRLLGKRRFGPHIARHAFITKMKDSSSEPQWDLWAELMMTSPRVLRLHYVDHRETGKEGLQVAKRVLGNTLTKNLETLALIAWGR